MSDNQIKRLVSIKWINHGSRTRRKTHTQHFKRKHASVDLFLLYPAFFFMCFFVYQTMLYMSISWFRFSSSRQPCELQKPCCVWNTRSVPLGNGSFRTEWYQLLYTTASANLKTIHRTVRLWPADVGEERSWMQRETWNRICEKFEVLAFLNSNWDIKQNGKHKRTCV